MHRAPERGERRVAWERRRDDLGEDVGESRVIEAGAAQASCHQDVERERDEARAARALVEREQLVERRRFARARHDVCVLRHQRELLPHACGDLEIARGLTVSDPRLLDQDVCFDRAREHGRPLEDRQLHFFGGHERALCEQADRSGRVLPLIQRRRLVCQAQDLICASVAARHQ